MMTIAEARDAKLIDGGRAIGLSFSEDAIRRLDNIAAMSVEAERKSRLYAPLLQLLTPKRYAYYMAGYGFETGEMSIHLPVGQWKKQHDAGITLCVGFHIEYWVRA